MKTCRVLIDGFNLRLTKGSGIKYYTISLIKAIEEKVDVSLLFDYPLKDIKNIQKVEFIEKYFKGNVDYNKYIAYLKLLKRAIKSPNAMKIKLDNDSIYEKEHLYLNNKTIININNIFTLNEIYAKFNLGLNIENTNNVDIFHATYMLNINVKRAKKITTIHDLIPLKLPYTTLDNKKIFYNKIKHAIKTSDKIITISESAKNDILNNFDIKEENVINCYQPYFLPKDLMEYSFNTKKFELAKNDYFLFVGNIEPKKNIGRVIQAYLNLDTPKKLVIVGKKAWLWEELLKGTQKAIKQNKIVLLDYVTREDLIALYQNAFGFVFPSLYEGFGLPPLEAMACKCPVITSNISSLPEVCGDAAIYCDAYSIISIQTAMEKLLNLSQNERDRLIQEGLKRVEFFNTNDYSKKVLEVYESVL